MRVFISWSKEPSRTVAEALRDWLPDVIQSIEPWMSSTDMGAGARWGTKVAEALASTKMGILCVTSDNQTEPWLLFEAGALAKTLDDTFVCPYLIQMRTADLASGPLTQFQAKLADHDGTFALLSTVNDALGAEALPADRLQRLFERSWPDLEAKLQNLPTPSHHIHRSQEEVLSEILETVRTLGRREPSVPTLAAPIKEMLTRHYRQELAVLSTAELPEMQERFQQMSDKEWSEIGSKIGHLVISKFNLPVDVIRQLILSPPATTSQSVEPNRGSELDVGSEQS